VLQTALTWSDSAAVAAALARAHPCTERLSLTPEDLRRRVLALPGFFGSEDPPSPKILDHILWTWMRLADGGRA